MTIRGFPVCLSPEFPTIFGPPIRVNYVIITLLIVQSNQDLLFSFALSQFAYPPLHTNSSSSCFHLDRRTTRSFF